MWPVSAAFSTEVRQSHRVATVCEVWAGATKLATLGTVTAGSVSEDRNRAYRRMANLTVADPDGTLTPDDASDLVAPTTGNELHLYRGIVLGSGVTELLPLGVYGISKFSVDSGDSGTTVALEAADRGRRVARNRFIDPYQVVAGQDVATVIGAILDDRYPGVAYDLPATGFNAGAAVLEAGESSDPWRDAQAIATSAGFDLAFDRLGVARLLNPGDALTATSSVATYTDTELQVLLSVSREQDTDETYSGVVASGESAANTLPVSATVWDDDPTSPTYYLGPFGAVPMFYVSPFLTTTDQCTSAAASLLATKSGAVEAVSWSQIVNPAHDAGDVIDITESSTKVDARVVLDSLTIPLVASDGMTAVARTRRANR